MWLLEASARQRIKDAQQAERTTPFGLRSDLEARAKVNPGLSQGQRILTVSEGIAEIAITGVITKSPSFLAMLLGDGNTTYPEIIDAVLEAEKNNSVDTITFVIDSPGGHFEGLFDLLAVMQSIKKRTKAVVSNVAASAAFAIASQADEIIASNVAARIGSVGVVATFTVYDDEIDITSTEAPNKRPDVKTEEGVGVVREELDALHEIFVDAIATGRGITAEKVNADFGRGGTVLATEALKRGMIDAIAAPSLKAVKNARLTPANGGNQPEANMDLKQLQAQHPEVYSAVVQQGITEERDRVSAHLTMGEASGDMKTACAAIKDGSSMTATLQATYMTAGMNKRDVANRQADDFSAGAGDRATAQEHDSDLAGDVASLIEAKLGLGE